MSILFVINSSTAPILFLKEFTFSTPIVTFLAFCNPCAVSDGKTSFSALSSSELFLLSDLCHWEQKKCNAEKLNTIFNFSKCVASYRSVAGSPILSRLQNLVPIQFGMFRCFLVSFIDVSICCYQ